MEEDTNQKQSEGAGIETGGGIEVGGGRRRQRWVMEKTLDQYITYIYVR